MTEQKEEKDVKVEKLERYIAGVNERLDDLEILEWKNHGPVVRMNELVERIMEVSRRLHHLSEYQLKMADQPERIFIIEYIENTKQILLRGKP